MTETYFPFADNNGDRVYSDADFAKYYSNFFSTGVISTIGQALAVTVTSSTTVQVGTGAASIQGRQYNNDAPISFTIPTTSPTVTTAGVVVIRLNYAGRTINAFYKDANTDGLNLVQDSNYYEIALAQVQVGPSGISGLVDMRSYVQPILSPVDLTTTLQTFQTNLQNFLGTIQGILTGDVAGNLAQEITTINSNMQNFVDLVSDQTINGEKTFADDVTFSENVTFDGNVSFSGNILALMTSSESWSTTFKGLTFVFYRVGLSINFTVSGSASSTINAGESFQLNYPIFRSENLAYYQNSYGSNFYRLLSGDTDAKNFSIQNQIGSGTPVRGGGSMLIDYRKITS